MEIAEIMMPKVTTNGWFSGVSSDRRADVSLDRKGSIMYNIIN
jgi:hypothetical protein